MAADPADRAAVAVDVSLLDGAAGSCVARRWHGGEVTQLDGVVELAPGDEAFDLWVPSPVVEGVAVFGDPQLYAGVGDRRIGRVTARDGGLAFAVYGRPGVDVEVIGWAAGKVRARRWHTAEAAELDVRTGDGGAWTVSVPVGPFGWTSVHCAAR